MVCMNRFISQDITCVNKTSMTNLPPLVGLL